MLPAAFIEPNHLSGGYNEVERSQTLWNNFILFLIVRLLESYRKLRVKNSERRDWGGGSVGKKHLLHKYGDPN